jgi:hypothetical protein
VGLIAVVALIVKGLQKRFSSVNVVVTALEIGTIESQMITRPEAVPAGANYLMQRYRRTGRHSGPRPAFPLAM